MSNPRRTAGAVSSSKALFKPLVVTGLTVAAVIYACWFLWQPVGQGLIGANGEEVSKGRFVLTSLLYPEVIISTWFDAGRLPRGFADRIPIVFGTLLWLALSALIGIPLVKPVFHCIRAWSSRIEQISTAILVGLALLSTLTLGVGLLGGLKSRLPMCTALVALVIMVYSLPRITGPRTSKRRAQSAARPNDSEPDLSLSTIGPIKKAFDRFFFVAVVAMTCFAAGTMMLGACLPPSEFDVLEYHLQAPKEFFQLGAIGFIPHNVYANMPLGTEMHSLAMMTLLGYEDPWLGGLIGKSITASISLVGAALLGAFITRKFGVLFGWIAAGLWLTSPGIAHVAMFGLIDGALATYILASAVAVFGALEALGERQYCLCREGEAPAEPKPSSAGASLSHWNPRQVDPEVSESLRIRLLTYWRLAGVTAGAAAAAKYPGLILAVIPVCALFAWAVLRYRGVFQKREAILVAGFIALELASTCGPWYAKNWFLAGNPFYPLAANVFGGKTLTPEKIEQWKLAHRVRDLVPTNQAGDQDAYAISFAPLATALSDAKRVGLASLFVQPAVIFGTLVCLFVAFKLRCDPLVRLLVIWIGWSGWILFIWWFATHRIDRFWLPLTGLWAGLGAIGFWWLHQNVSAWLPQVIVVLGIGYGCVLDSSPAIADNRYFVSLAALRVDAGDENQVPTVFPTTAWVNKYLENRNVRILLIGEARVYEFLAPIEYSTCFDVNPGEVYLKGKSRTEQLETLRQRGITHIMVQWAEIDRYRYPNNYGFSDWPQPSDIQKLVDDGVASRVNWGFPISMAELLEVK